MHTLNLVSRRFFLGAAGMLILMSAPAMGSAQDITTSHTQPGIASVETRVRNAEIVYVEGNDLVLRLEDGKIEHMLVPDSDVFALDGKDVSVHELKPGTRLTQTITTTTAPRYVKSVRTIKGKVWHVNAPNSVIVSLPDGTNQIYRVPAHAQFIVNGHPRTANYLRKGMSFEATIVTDDTHTVVSENKTMSGQAPPPSLPRMVGLLLFPQTATTLQPDPTPAANVTAEHAWSEARLPQTGSPLPLIGLLGITAVALSLGLRLAGKNNEI